MSISLNTMVSTLLSNKRRVSALKSLGVMTVGDALTYYPFRVVDPVPLKTVREAIVGRPMAFAATVRELRVTPMNARRGYRLEAVVDDADFAHARSLPGASARLTFFSYRKSYVDWVGMRLAAGNTVVVSGTPSEYMGQLQFTHPEVLTVAPRTDKILERTDSSAPSVPTGMKYDALTVEDALIRVTRPRPVYHASSRISSEHIHETILGLLWMLGARVSSAQTDMPEVRPGASDAANALVVNPPDTQTIAPQNGEDADVRGLQDAIADVLPESVREARGLMHRDEAFLAVHDPQSRRRFDQAIATLRYEEAFVSQTSLLKARQRMHASKAHELEKGVGLRERFIASLPFSLTDGQRAVVNDISADLGRDRPMQRLLQGEVGSGKTVVALAAMLEAVGAGYQAVLVAPTQVLAEQHAETIATMVAALGDQPAQTPDGEGNPEYENVPVAHGGGAVGVPVTLITGGMKLAARRKALAIAASGEPGIIVATHAAFSKSFQVPHLALVVIDEQHRFGVEQRESLNAKSDDGTAPHMLVMTATPIPRTAAMTWFGDLDISWLTELPGGRKPIRTIVVNESDSDTMGRMFAHIRSRIDAGERAYIVCPRIDDEQTGSEAGQAEYGIDDPYEQLDENGDAAVRPPLHSVEEIAQRLSKLPQFKGVAFATLTGRDKDETKTRVMADFASGKTPILVSTTVIEVGVDVRQASCMVIFDADRYGLSQLHQLRGRVGRGGTNSWAFLISRAQPESIAASRLEVIHGSLDGAEIAQADLELRGAGDVLGDVQSGGKSSLKLLRVVKDADLIEDARKRARRLLDDDPDLSGEVQLAGAVLDFTRGNETFLTSS